LWYAYFQLHHSLKKAIQSAYRQLFFLFPFCLPFITISLLLDGLEHLPAWQQRTLPLSQEMLLLLFSLCLVILTLIFLPACIVICWRCHPLQQVDLKERLERLCASLHFRHAGLKIWSVMSHSFTAGIVGIVPAFRYILFTPPLLHRFRPEEIEAILVHEIGHNRYRHLLFYPFIMLGMLILGALALLGLEKSFDSAITSPAPGIGYFTLVMGLFLLYALLMGLYFRVVFGFFSRLFERQADLYIFETSLSPVYLVQALDRLGVVTGYTHTHPNWHHFSLQHRIRFLYRAMEDPLLIQRHHRRVKKWLIIYFLALLLGCLALYAVL
jgi:STE24 endopeptidase